MLAFCGDKYAGAVDVRRAGHCEDAEFIVLDFRGSAEAGKAAKQGQPSPESGDDDEHK